MQTSNVDVDWLPDGLQRFVFKCWKLFPSFKQCFFFLTGAGMCVAGDVCECVAGFKQDLELGCRVDGNLKKMFW